jgi:hypothetical protein
MPSLPQALTPDEPKARRPAAAAPLPQDAVQPAAAQPVRGSPVAATAGGSAATGALEPSAPSPIVLPVRLVAAPGRPRALLLPFTADTGAALLRRGDAILAVFDAALPLDLSALRRDPVFAGVEAIALPGATLLRLPLAPPATLRARREGNAWLLEHSRPVEFREGRLAPEDRAVALEA